MSLKKTYYIVIILTLILSCQKKKIEVVKPLNYETTILDSTKIDSIGDRKSIHQQEWEEHSDSELDSLSSN